MCPIIPFGRPRSGSPPPGGPGSDRPDKLFLFRVGARELASEAVKIIEVMLAPKLVPLAEAPGFVLGVANIRGNIVPVVDIHARLGETAPAGGAAQRLVIVRLAGEYVGFLVDGVDLRLTEGTIEGRSPRKGNRGRGKLTVVDPTPAPRQVRVGEQRIPVFEPESLATVDELAVLKRVRAMF